MGILLVSGLTVPWRWGLNIKFCGCKSFALCKRFEWLSGVAVYVKVRSEKRYARISKLRRIKMRYDRGYFVTFVAMKCKSVSYLLVLLLGWGAPPFASLFAQRTASFPKSTADEDPYTEYIKAVETFGSLLRNIKMYYIDSLSTRELYKRGIKGVLASLDPYCEYYSAQEEGELRLLTTGEYGGVGAVVMPAADSSVMVARLFEGKPAHLAGVQAGDVFLKIDGVDFSKSDVQRVSEALKGSPESPISLVLKRRGEEAPIQLSFLRKRIQIEPVSYHDVRPGTQIGYISVDAFNDKTATAFGEALRDLKSRTKLKGLIIDLRGNGGGLVGESVGILGHFLPKGTEVATLRSRDNAVSAIYQTSVVPSDPNLPLVVLINEETASTSELLAGALQDYDRAVIVGRKSFGKGIVQTTAQMPYGGRIKFTISRYHIPSGRCIQRINYRKSEADSSHHIFYTKAGRPQPEAGGIAPDFEVKADSTKVISYFVAGNYLVEDFATDYQRAHRSIAKPDRFSLSDKEYEELIGRLSVPAFKYELRSPSYLKDLRRLAESEGFLPEATEAFDTLSELLKPDVRRDLIRYKADVKKWVEEAIVHRYYHEKGLTQYRLRSDSDVSEAVRILSDEDEYQRLLLPKR